MHTTRTMRRETSWNCRSKTFSLTWEQRLTLNLKLSSRWLMVGPIVQRKLLHVNSEISKDQVPVKTCLRETGFKAAYMKLVTKKQASTSQTMIRCWTMLVAGTTVTSRGLSLLTKVASQTKVNHAQITTLRLSPSLLGYKVWHSQTLYLVTQLLSRKRSRETSGWSRRRACWWDQLSMICFRRLKENSVIKIKTSISRK